MTSTTKRTGRCSCGAVRYEAAGEPMMNVDCYCLECQRSTGSGHSSNLAYRADQLTISGDLKATGYVADSGNKVTARFCPSCGTLMTFQSEGMPQMIAVRVGTLDDPSGYRPQIAVYVKRRQPWDHLVEGIPAFPERPSMPPRS